MRRATTPADELRLRLNWSDFQTVLAVSRHGSVAKAFGPLGMTHSTLLRKLDLIESRLSTKVFNRGRPRYTLTAAGHEIERAAREFEPLAVGAEMRASGADLRPSGEVRVSVSSIVIDHLLPAVLAQFRSSFPDVQIELVSTREHVNLRRREADIAIRIADTVPDWLVGRRLADLDFKIYARRTGRGKLPLQDVEALLGQRRWISFERDTHDLKFDRWLSDRVAAEQVVLRVDNFSHAANMVRAGIGIALLPSFVELSIPDLQPLTSAIPELVTPMWLVTHPELRDAARIQVLTRAIGPALANAVAPARHADEKP
ncbi:LysR family transcriptional regulator [Hydrogenophaga sp.]|uniref:LysR family transcriptional regulator n=1 Tax=Hydrogenophaga sp. TaxID=1904254 RepID=UPI003F6F0775